VRPLRFASFAGTAALALAATRVAAQDPHAGHGAPAAPADSAGHVVRAIGASPVGRGARPAARGPGAEVRVLSAQLSARGAGGGAPMQDGQTQLRLRVTDPATGRPATGLVPSAWIDVRHGATATSRARCEQRIGALNEASTMIKHGQISLSAPVEDLNGHHLAVLAREPAVAVIDPIRGFGRTRLLTAVRLPAPGFDWASTPDDLLLFVSIPDSGVVAVIDTHGWTLRGTVRTGGTPRKVVMDPRGTRVWVSVDGPEPAIAVIDVARQAVVARVRMGAGPHALAFSDDGATAFVASRGAGTLAVIDAASGRVTAEVRTGMAPADVAWSPRLRAAFVANEGDGTVAVVDPARGIVTERIRFAPGIASIRFAPEAADHAAHGDPTARPTPGGRLAFILNPRTGTLDLYDAVTRRTLRSLAGAANADQVAFTASFAYVRAAGTPQVAMIPLANPTTGALGAHDAFPAGNEPPGAVGDSLGDVLVAQPGMHDAIYVANPAEKMVYSYHYMEGMPVPHGGLTTYAFHPRSIRAVSRRLHEAEPGVYTATVRLEDAGDYDLVLRSADPHLVGCYGFTVAPSGRAVDATLAVEAADPERRLPVGPATLRLRVRDAAGTAVEGIRDVRVTLASPEGFRRQAEARAGPGGIYAAEFDLPAAGTYVAVVDIPSRGVAGRGRPIYFRAVP
jgi:YVTN family beta-propeller protein